MSLAFSYLHSQPLENYMKIGLTSSIALAATLGALMLGGCEVKKTQEGSAPKVNVTGGQLPKYDVKTPEVSVGAEKKEINVPTDIDVKTEKREVTVPNINVTPASEASKK